MNKRVLSRLSLMLSLALFLFLGLMTMQVQSGMAATHADPVPVLPDVRGRISGTVRDETGKGLPGIDVTIERATSGGGWIREWPIPTDERGRYSADSLVAGVYRVGFRDPSGVYALQFYSQTLAAGEALPLVINGNTYDNIDAGLEKAGNIGGRVLSEEFIDGSVGAFAQVGERWELVSTTSVARDLYYRFDGLPPATYRVCAIYWYWYLGAPPCYDRVGGGVAFATDVPLAGGSTITGIDLTTKGLVDAAIITGVVTGANNKPLAGITASALVFDLRSPTKLSAVAEAQTNASGIYQLSNLAPGEYVIRFEDWYGPFFPQYYDNVTELRQSTLLTLQRLEQRGAINAKLAAGGMITGLLLFDGAFPPVTATVEAIEVSRPWQYIKYEGNYDAITGHYRIQPMLPGVYIVSAGTRDPADSSRWLYEEQYSDGSVPGQATPLTVTAGSVLPNINFNFAAGFHESAITGAVTGPKGKPLMGIRVELSEGEIGLPGPLFLFTVTDSAGRYQFSGLEQGGYFMRFVDPANIHAPLYWPQEPRRRDAWEVSLPHAYTLDNINTQLPLGSFVRGQVTTNDGSPVEGAEIRLMLEEDAIAIVQSDAQGRYDSGALPPGDYQVCATSRDFERERQSCLGYEFGVRWPGLKLPLSPGDRRSVDLVFDYVVQFSHKLYLPSIGRREELAFQR